MAEGIQVMIRPLAGDEVELVERYLRDGPPDKHRKRFAEQEQGRVVYLIAWHEQLPIGHALLKWGGTDAEPMVSMLRGCPDIEDLFVNPEYRASGVGSQLLDVAEELVREAGYSCIGLGVGIDNEVARELYESRGYRYAGLGEYTIGGRYIDRRGRERIWKETCIYLTRRLDTDEGAEPLAER